jgi:peptidoglycan/LPS O-acetylase OafA/YrhL
LDSADSTSCNLFKKESLFPGLNALGLALSSIIDLIKGNDSNAGIINSLLKNKFIVLIGTISPMYLWHWPIFAFLKYFAVEFGLRE